MTQIDQYREYLWAILMAMGMQLRSLDMADPKAIQTAASLITLWSQFGFQRLTTDPADETLGAVNILVSLLRLMRLRQGDLEAGLDPGV